MRGKRKQSKGKHSKKLLYIVSVSALIALVGVAFFSPGWVFGLQDGRQCRDTVLEERENTDVAVLSTNYETSFYQRMVNFAENRTESANFLCGIGGTDGLSEAGCVFEVGSWDLQR